MGDSAAAKKPAAAAAAERSSTKAKPEHSQTPRRASKATSRTPHHESSSRQPSGRKFMGKSLSGLLLCFLFTDRLVPLYQCCPTHGLQSHFRNNRFKSSCPLHY